MNVTVFCGSAAGNQSLYMEEAKRLGSFLAKEGHTLIYGGARVGTMGALAKAVKENGGQVIGILPRFLAEREIAMEGLDQLIMTSDMDDRKKKMIELGDAYIALPGGPGTLEEIAQVYSWVRVGLETAPCILYAENDYWDPLRELFVTMIREGFLKEEDTAQLHFVSSFEELQEVLNVTKA